MLKPESSSSPSPPSGTVTLLFTDIVGSSHLWEQHGDRFIPIWQAHDAVLRDAFARFGGYEVKSEGDAFMVAFPDAAAALNCALFAQAALARYPWPPGIEPLRVRMGLHTGEPIQHRNDYFGPVVNRAANTCKAAHGGQVLLTDETLNAIEDRLDARIQITDLGDYRLKDMGTPQRLYQAYHPSIEPRKFPPPRALDGQPHNLPVQRTSFVGRAREIEQIAAFLAQGQKPVLTITGPGGIGKTRLSLQAAAAHAEWFPDGVWYIKLREARDMVGAAVELAEAMNIPLNPSQPLLAQVRQWLADRRCLLILDDANALPQADRLLRELLSGSTNLRCLATTRESLQIDEADDLTLAGLSTTFEARDARAQTTQGAAAQGPNGEAQGDVLTDTEAGRLLAERVAAANPDFAWTPAEVAAAEELLPRLEGVPESIERAANLMGRVPPSVVLTELDRRLNPEFEPESAPTGVARLKGILQRGAQRVRTTVEEATRAPAVNLSRLLQGLANVATDRHDQQQAAELGRESLRLSQEAGDDLGVAAALRQLAIVKWQQGDRQSAVAMLSAAVQLYRQHASEEAAMVQRELDDAREALPQMEGKAPAALSVESAVAMALGEEAP
jgi:class 3 adenylate cyclase